MTKKELYRVYADICRDAGKNPIYFKTFLTISIAARRADTKEMFMRFVAAYGAGTTRAGKTKKILTAESGKGYAESLKTFERLPPRQTAGFFMPMADENRKYAEYRSAFSKGLSESATSQNRVAY